MLGGKGRLAPGQRDLTLVLDSSAVCAEMKVARTPMFSSGLEIAPLTKTKTAPRSAPR